MNVQDSEETLFILGVKPPEWDDFTKRDVPGMFWYSKIFMQGMQPLMTFEST